MALLAKKTSLTKNWEDFTDKKKAKKIGPRRIGCHPYGSVGKLFIQELGTSSQVGTAFKVGSRIAMTAAHCLCNIDESDLTPIFHKDLLYAPQFPYLEKYIKATYIGVPSEYSESSGHSEYDFGFILFEEDLPGETLEIDFNPMESGSALLLGYPDKDRYFGEYQYEKSIKYSSPYLEDMFLMKGTDFRSGSSGGPAIDKKTGKVISLISSTWGIHADETMAGPIMRDLVKKYFHKF